VKTQWHGISRRRSVVMVSAVAALLVSGGVAVAASGDDAATTKTGITLTEVPGNPHPHHVQPATPAPLEDIELSEVPGAEPHDVQPGHATPLPDAPVVIGDEGQTLARP
jgi:hypothetical protein